MRSAIALFSSIQVSSILVSSIFALPVPALAFSSLVVDDLAHHPIAAEFPSGGQLELHFRSAEIHIVGSDEDKVIVRVEGKHGSESTDIKATFERNDRFGKLRISGGPNNDVKITIQVPRKSDLSVSTPAGDVELRDIVGNKKVDLSAGNLTIVVGNTADYAHVKASVTTGSIEGGPFGQTKGGLFRSFEKFGSGKYKLEAHVGAGAITFK
jgi:hypothetical protein